MIKSRKSLEVAFTIFILLSLSLVNAQVGTYPTVPDVAGASQLASGIFAIPIIGKYLLQSFDTCLNAVSLSLLYADSFASYFSFFIFSLICYPLICPAISLLDILLVLSVITVPCLSLLAMPLNIVLSLIPEETVMLDISGLLNTAILSLNVLSNLFSISVSVVGQFGGLFTGLILMLSRVPVPILDSIFISLGRVVYFALSSGLSFGYIERSVEPLKALLPK